MSEKETKEIVVGTVAQKTQTVIERCTQCKKPRKSEFLPPGIMFCKCGRPTEYSEEMLEAARKYLAIKMPSKELDEVVHSVEGLADYIDIARSTVYEWRIDPDKKTFSDIVERILRKQAKSLLNNGLGGRFNASITKLMATKHGYRDSVENLTVTVPIDPEKKARADGAIDDYLGENKNTQA